MKTETHVWEELGRLPKTLSELYAKLHADMAQLAPGSRHIAERTLLLMRICYRPLTIYEMVDAVSVLDNGRTLQLRPRDILDVTCNLVVEDSETHVFCYAHLLVLEYFEHDEQSSQEEMHVFAAWRCLDPYLVLRRSDSFYKYALAYWHHHAVKAGMPLRKKMLLPTLWQMLFGDKREFSFFSQWKHHQVVTNRHLTGSRLFHWQEIQRHTRTPLLTACAFGFAEVLEMLGDRQLLAQEDLFDCPSPLLSGFHVGVYYGQIEVVEVFLKREVNTNEYTLLGGNAIHVAARSLNGPMVTLLLEHGADIDASTTHGKTALHLLWRPDSELLPAELLTDGMVVDDYAVSKQVQLLLERGANANMSDNFGNTPLHLVVSHQSRLVAGSSSVWKPSTYTAVHSPRFYSAVMRMMQMLMDHGANVNAKDKGGSTPLHILVQTISTAFDAEETSRLLIQYGADIRSRNNEGRSVLDIAGP